MLKTSLNEGFLKTSIVEIVKIQNEFILTNQFFERFRADTFWRKLAKISTIALKLENSD